ncbi:MAG: undecaprenyldiphospho-muramoylpentapeptide beta-N-acetylglucosaminyltransferase [Desulfuromonadales bacterium]|nr:undecaprenyldiphospho-muramoylpentapeptide beta-N-acetylglucosaminyltransferase [Desulfuromonadales bacterium]
MRMLLAGGGTGGHLFPAVALAQRLLETDATAQVLFIGTAKGIEATILPELGLPLETIKISGIAGRGWFERLRVAPALVQSVRQSLVILKKFQPNLVVGVGGYASGPVLIAARLAGVPFLIHEQNAEFGLTNRFLARWAQRICLSFPPTADRPMPSERTVVTGNPVRHGMTAVGPIPAAERTLLVFGGSRGAQAINDAVVAAIPALRQLCPELRIIHQTGSTDYDRIAAAYTALGLSTKDLSPFLQDMASAYAQAHLVMCRAGATTLAELTVTGRPAILIPYPYAAADHQTANARILAEQGAALLLPQSETTAATLATLLGNLLNDRPTLLRMGAIARALGQPAAVDKLLAECHSIARKG